LVDLFHENWNNSKVYQEKDKNKSKHHATLKDSVKHHNNILKRPFKNPRHCKKTRPDTRSSSYISGQDVVWISLISLATD
jgi:predicted glycosyltransferase involved in capsule biosynthesis